MTLTIPVGPEARRLRFLFETRSGATPSSGVEEYWDGDINWVTPEDLGKLSDRYVRETRRRITEEGYKNCGVSLAGPGSIVLSKRAPIGQTAILGVPSTCNQGCFLLTKVDGVDERFYYYALIHLRPALEALGRGSTFMELSADDLRSVSIPFPSEEHQRRIANCLDLETARIDGLIAEKESMLALLEEKRAALISRVVTRGLDHNAPLKPSGQEWLGEIPAHWGLQRLKQLAEVRGGLTLGKQYAGELLEYPYLRVANVQDGYLKLDDVLTVEVPASEAASNLLAYGDVLMNEGGDIDKLGRGCVWRDEISPCLHQNHVFAVRPHSVDSDWLALWTSTLQAKRYFESRAKRSTNLASISGSNIKELPVPLPSIDEQSAIKQFLVEKHSRLETVRSELRASLRLLTERRAALITAAVTGQIPVEDMTG